MNMNDMCPHGMDGNVCSLCLANKGSKPSILLKDPLPTEISVGIVGKDQLFPASPFSESEIHEDAHEFKNKPQAPSRLLIDTKPTIQQTSINPLLNERLDRISKRSDTLDGFDKEAQLIDIKKHIRRAL